MDKLKSTASEASTLEWGKRMTGFISCSVVAAVCLILGVYMLCVPLIGPTLFTVFYTIGNTCGVCSTMFLMEPEKQLTLMFDETRVHATAAVIACLVLTLCAAFWVKSAGLALLFCILQVLSFIWYLLTYIPNRREAIMKMVETSSKILSDSIQPLVELVNKVKAMYENSPALAVSAGLVSTLCAAFLWSTFGLGLLLFGILGGLLCTGISQSSIPSVREDIMKMVETCKKILSSCTKFLKGLLQPVKSIRAIATTLAVIAGLVSTLLAAFLGSGFGLALLFGILGGFLIYWLLSYCSKFLMGLLQQLTWIWDKARPLAIIICLLLTLLAVFWWKRAGLALLFYILTMVLILW
ncbi:uncharacterized protein LOC115591002 [Sparus aurata]|nr:uncharacterized protein LOC115591002 [Sparus aurata]XP_030288407.1 uncharacterized protein LOC115591002 [Sparus aurata]